MISRLKVQTQLNYHNIEARMFSPVKGPVNINNNSTITKVAGRAGGLEISFIFTSNYEPNIGLVKIEGSLLVSDSKKNIKQALEKWKSSEQKNLPKEMAERVHNTILANCIVEATILSREVHLPAPMPTPRVSMKEKDIREGEEERRVDYIR